VGKLWRRILRDCEGSALVEFTVVFPIFMVVAFGTVDVSYMLFEWSQANKATYVGARRAIVSDPIATGINNLQVPASDSTQTGFFCFDPNNSAQLVVNPLLATACPTVNTTCTAGSSGGSCTGGETWNEAPFTNASKTGIFDMMQAIFPRLQRQDVQIQYRTNLQGFIGETNTPTGGFALPMTVTVSIRCMTHQIFFIGNLIGGAAPGAGCPAGPAGPAIPAFSTTLSSESLFTT
jgi:Flp pilus assembly protein TadG